MDHAFEDAFDPARALDSGWQAVKRFWPVLFVGGCLKGCTEGGSGGNGSGMRDGEGDDAGVNFGSIFDAAWPLRVQEGWGLPVGSPMPEALAGFGLGLVVAVAVVLLVLVLCFRAWLIPGWIKLHRRILAEGAGDFGTLFSGASHFLPMLGWVFVEFVILFGSLVLAAIPGGALVVLDQTWLGVLVLVLLVVPVAVYVGLGLSFGAHAVVIEDLGPADALGRSWDMARGNRARLFFFRFVMWLVQVGAVLVGLCLFCVGILLTRPLGLAVAEFGFTEAYLRYTRPPEETGAWRAPWLQHPRLPGG